MALFIKQKPYKTMDDYPKLNMNLTITKTIIYIVTNIYAYTLYIYTADQYREARRAAASAVAEAKTQVWMEFGTILSQNLIYILLLKISRSCGRCLYSLIMLINNYPSILYFATKYEAIFNKYKLQHAILHLKYIYPTPISMAVPILSQIIKPAGYCTFVKKSSTFD